MKNFMLVINALGVLGSVAGVVGHLLIGKFGIAWLIFAVGLYFCGNFSAIAED